MSPRLDAASRRLVDDARLIAGACGEPAVGPLHLLRAFYDQPGCPATELLTDLLVRLDDVEAQLHRECGARSDTVALEDTVERTLELAQYACDEAHQTQIQTGHILVGLLEATREVGPGPVTNILISARITPRLILRALADRLHVASLQFAA